MVVTQGLKSFFAASTRQKGIVVVPGSRCVDRINPICHSVWVVKLDVIRVVSKLYAQLRIKIGGVDNTSGIQPPGLTIGEVEGFGGPSTNSHSWEFNVILNEITIGKPWEFLPHMILLKFADQRIVSVR